MDQVKINFNFDGRTIFIQCQTSDKMEQIINKFKLKIQNDININSYYFTYLYGGNQINDMNKTFNDIANSFDKERKIMEIIVHYIEIPNDINTSSNIIVVNPDNPGDNKNISLPFCKKYKKLIIISSSIAVSIIIFNYYSDKNKKK